MLIVTHVFLKQITANCKLNSAIQQKFPFEISEILRAEWGVSKRRGSGRVRGRGRDQGRGLSFFKEYCFRVRDGVWVDTNPNHNPILTLTLRQHSQKKKMDPDPDFPLY